MKIALGLLLLTSLLQAASIECSQIGTTSDVISFNIDKEKVTADYYHTDPSFDTEKTTTLAIENAKDVLLVLNTYQRFQNAKSGELSMKVNVGKTQGNYKEALVTITKHDEFNHIMLYLNPNDVIDLGYDEAVMRIAPFSCSVNL